VKTETFSLSFSFPLNDCHDKVTIIIYHQKLISIHILRSHMRVFSLHWLANVLASSCRIFPKISVLYRHSFTSIAVKELQVDRNLKAQFINYRLYTDECDKMFSNLNLFPSSVLWKFSRKFSICNFSCELMKNKTLESIRITKDFRNIDYWYGSIYSSKCVRCFSEDLVGR